MQSRQCCTMLDQWKTLSGKGKHQKLDNICYYQAETVPIGNEV